MRYFIIGLCLAGLMAGLTIRAEDGAKEDKEETAGEILQKCADSYYDLTKEELRRYTCFIKSPEIVKSVNLRSKVILDNVDYELAWEPNKPVTVKPREIPPYFGEDGREDTRICAQLMELAMRQLFQAANPVNEVVKALNSLSDEDKYEMVLSKDLRNLNKVEAIPKKKEKSEKKTPRLRDRSKKETEEKNPFESLAIWINKDYQITKFELRTEKEKLIGTITPQKYNKLWGIKQLDITKADNEDNFLDRITIDFTYTYQDKFMLFSSMKFTMLDSKGKVLERRNEVNPISVTFSQYEIEKKEKIKDKK
ncbi:MAG: hypothetical protein HY811_07955 [Planctomycetes bacterium]|nr:hypothetical protein [Planctomycetota bacterium]